MRMVCDQERLRPSPLRHSIPAATYILHHHLCALDADAGWQCIVTRGVKHVPDDASVSITTPSSVLGFSLAFAQAWCRVCVGMPSPPYQTFQSPHDTT